MAFASADTSCDMGQPSHGWTVLDKNTDWYILACMNKAERTRQLIVEKTAPIFNTKGYAGTSLADMTEATGLTKGSVYGNFANKEEVALAAFDHNWKQVQSAVRNEMAAKTTSMEKLLALTGVYENLPEGFPEGGCPLLNTAIEADDTHPALREKALEAFRSWQSNLVSVIKAGIASREFRRDVDPEQAAVTLIALIEGAVMISRLTGNAAYNKAVMSAVEKTVVDLA
ncbi:transcriptional regulator [Cupriavidus sp. TA19]|uniref:TetR/AcrR family transcriptional regulator n=1 Tax=unclassified Cupriavidus TaxID=2640874 RepID=UPI000ED28B92|nr:MULTISPECIES: TetR/AcrR family transcriptional regulator [unclassified Cupriavidus]BDB26696.1 TetR/AcrR family transcriptional regulator [Cupriavidus sp. P-10]GLC92696.1 transcriptional regulator [Cupriavidus sp. TA19]